MFNLKELALAPRARRAKVIKRVAGAFAAFIKSVIFGVKPVITGAPGRGNPGFSGCAFPFVTAAVPAVSLTI